MKKEKIYICDTIPSVSGYILRNIIEAGCLVVEHLLFTPRTKYNFFYWINTQFYTNIVSPRKMDGNELNPDGIAELCFFLPKKLVNAYCDVEFI